VHAKAYKTFEKNGLVWAYMGNRADAPAEPQIEAALLPQDEIDILIVQRECNWLQALEGDIDTSHAGFLHYGHVEADEIGQENPTYQVVKNRAPEYRVVDTPFGTSYGAHRDAAPGQTYWRVANFMFPFWTQPPTGVFPKQIQARAWVPMDDTHSMLIQVYWKGSTRTGLYYHGTKTAQEKANLMRRKLDYQPNTTDWFGRWRVTDDEATDWGIDRSSMKNGMQYSGIHNIHMQDQAVTESMGGITDHSFEHLAPSDQMIARTRRRLLRTARAFREQGTVPPGVDDPAIYMTARAGNFTLDSGLSFEDAYKQQVAAVERPTMQQAAE